MDEKKPLEIRLASMLMRQNGITVKPGMEEKHPKFNQFKERSENVTKHLGAEDYLSLQLAVDYDDEETVDTLISKAESNKRENQTTVTAESLKKQGFNFVVTISESSRRSGLEKWLKLNNVAFRSVGSRMFIKAEPMLEARLTRILESRKNQNNKYSGKTQCIEGADMKIQRPVSFTKGEKVIYEGRRTVVQVPNGPANTIGVVVNGKLQMVNRREVTKVTEGVLGMTNVAALSRMRQLAGLPITEDESDEPMLDMGNDPLDPPPVVMNDEPAADIVDDMEPVDDLGAVTDVPALPAPSTVAPIPTPVGGAIAMGGDDFSEEYKEAVEALDRISRLVMDMKISEFKMFVDRAEDFHNKVKETGKRFLDIDNAIATAMPSAAPTTSPFVPPADVTF
jgi:hypothetical protein